MSHSVGVRVYRDPARRQIVVETDGGVAMWPSSPSDLAAQDAAQLYAVRGLPFFREDWADHMARHEAGLRVVR